MSRPAEGHRLPVFLTLCSLLVLFQIYVIFLQPHGTPSTTGGQRRLLGEVAGAVAAVQTFEMGANGLESITVHAEPSDQVRGTVVFELAELVGDAAAPVTLFRDTREAAVVARGGPFTWRFNPIEGTRGKQFALTVSMPNAPFGEGRALRLHATRGERYAGGALTYDGRSEWGDLVFSTEAARATSFRRFEHALRDKPWWLRSRVTLAAAFLLYNLALFTVFWTILTAPDEEVAPPATEPPPLSARRRLAMAVAVVVALGGLYLWLVPRRPWLEFGAVELLDQLPEATLRTTWPTLQQGFVETEATAGGRRYRCVTALPPSRIVFAVDVPEDAEFAAWVGMRPDVWQGPGDGATFRIGFGDGTSYEERYRRHFYPLERPIDRVLAPVRFDLSKYAGRRIDIVLNTEPSFNAVGDAALWCEPRIVRR